MFKKIVVFIALACLMPSLYADEISAASGFDHAGWYVGGDLGSIRVKVDHEYGGEDTNRVGSIGIYGGYNFTDYFGLEMLLVDSGDLSDSRFYEAYYLPVLFAPKFTWQITDYFALFAKAGIASAIYAEHYNYQPYNADDSIVWSGAGGMVGVGAQVSITKNLNIRLAYDHTRMTMSPTDDFFYDGIAFIRIYDVDVTANRVAVGAHWQF